MSFPFGDSTYLPVKESNLDQDLQFLEDHNRSKLKRKEHNMFFNFSTEKRDTTLIKKRNNSSEQQLVFFIPLLLCVIFIIWYAKKFPKKLGATALFLINKNGAYAAFRDQKALNITSPFWLMIISFLSIGLLISNLDYLSEIPLKPWQVFLGTFGLLFTFNAFKIALISGFGALFQSKAISKEHLLSIIYNYSLIGIILLPLVVLSYFFKFLDKNFFLNLAFFVIIILFVVRLVRTFYWGLTLSSVPRLYIILYLCSLEILPVLIVVKFALVRLDLL